MVASADPAFRGAGARKVDLQGDLVDVASFEGGVYDLRTYDLKTACPDPAACAYGVVVDNELHRLDDASNEMVAAAVADTGPEANWFVTISGERGADGRVSIDRIDPATDREEEGTSSSSLSCWPNCGGPGYGKPRATGSIVEKKPPVVNGQ